MQQGEITNKALASLLSLAAKAPEDLEGLLFGRIGTQGSAPAADCDCADVATESGPCAMVESCRLTGAACSIIAGPSGSLTPRCSKLIDERMKHGLRLLGWFSVRRSQDRTARGGVVRPTQMEKNVHTRVGREVAKQCSRGGEGRALPALGCIVMVHREAGDLGSFAIDGAWVSGIEMLPVAMKVQSLGSVDAGGPALFSWPLPRGDWPMLFNNLDKQYGEFASKLLNDLISKLSKAVVEKSKAVADAKSKRADAKGDLESAKGELESLANVEADLHSECDFVLKNFEVRQKARSTELEALQAATAILSGAKSF